MMLLSCTELKHKHHFHNSVGRMFVCGSIDPSFEPHQRFLTGVWKRMAWPPRGQKVGVTPEVNLRKHVTCTPLPSANKAAHSGFETQRRHHQKSKTVVSVAPEKVLKSSNIFFKNRQQFECIVLFYVVILHEKN